MKKIFISAFISVGFLFFFSCNDKPTELGYNLIYDTLTFYGVSSSSTKLFDCFTQLTNRENIHQTGVIYIGSAKNIKAISMLRFPKLPDSLLDVTITNAELTIQPRRYALGDTVSGNFSFKLYKILKQWTFSTKWDSIYDNGGNTFYFDDFVLGAYSGKIQLLDTMLPIKININKSLFEDWKQFTVDTSKPEPPGIALIPDLNCTVLHSFSAQTPIDTRVRPYIKIWFTKKDNSQDSVILRTLIDVSLFDAPLPQGSDITLQGGVSYHTKVCFDLSAIPILSSIYKADIELTINRDSSIYGNQNLDTVIMAAYYKDQSVDSGAIIGPYYGYRTQSSDKFYFFSVSSAVERWLRKEGKGELVFSVLDYRNPNRISLFGINHPDSTKKPKMRIIYSSRPKILGNK